MPPAILYRLAQTRIADLHRELGLPHANTHARAPRPRVPGRCGAPHARRAGRRLPMTGTTAPRPAPQPRLACHADPVPHH
jgi:hypothetical protein